MMFISRLIFFQFPGSFEEDTELPAGLKDWNREKEPTTPSTTPPAEPVS